MFGVLSAPNMDAVQWLEALRKSAPALQARLVVSVYPTCRTRRTTLEALLDVTEQSKGQFQFHLFAEHDVMDRAASFLCLANADGASHLVTGATENLGLATTLQSHLNWTIPVTPATRETTRNWFDVLWVQSAPLSHAIAMSFPQLRLAEGDTVGDELWRGFMGACISQAAAAQGTPETAAEEEVDLTEAVDPETGRLKTKEGAPPSVTDEIGVPPIDPLQEWLAALYERGLLVTVDRSDRIPPLSTPIQPEWFGLTRQTNAGNIIATLNMRLLAFDRDLQKRVDKSRDQTADLLKQFTFSIANGTFWVPHAALPLLEQHLEQSSADSTALLKETIGSNVGEYLEKQRDRIRIDAQSMYEQYHPNAKMPETAVDAIMDALRKRLGAILTTPLVPKLAKSAASFRVGKETNWSSAWSHAYQLVRSIVMLPRTAIAKPARVRLVSHELEASLREASNVVDDPIFRSANVMRSGSIAMAELKMVERLDASSASHEEKCRALWQFLVKSETISAEEVIAKYPAQISADELAPEAS